ncbi:MAG: bifunctional UDP-N-acetylmuramoyl-tripeptide:D-alanyl-D-alanine ligase/alanine racemase [Burkholderiales bacterium]|nr:bifunctional UDP-N-acetylmuramoyl-tripeptide:D-alanyl-D-alanine ligase/alanine racemase [Bacteroidia bacterium]
MYNPQQISEIIQATMVGDADHLVQNLLIDSRQLTEPALSVFIALKTERNDAHQYIYGLCQKGVKTFIVQQIPENCTGLKDNVCFLIVSDTLKALQQLAAFHRKEFKIPVIGVTGSNGKTIVKEWLYQLLKSDYVISRSPKSYNSQVGVPLSVWQLNTGHELGIFEAGISAPGEMDLLREIIRPTIGVLTSLGTAHDEGFSDSSQKLKEKLLLFTNSETVIVNALSFKKEHFELVKKNVFLISKSPNATLEILKTENLFTHTHVKAHYKAGEINIDIPFTDSASVENAITCWAVMLHLNIPHSEIEKRMLLLQTVAMRLELKLGNNNCVLINDFYNSDINALEIALHHQKQQNRGGKKVVILSDIEQSGKPSAELYEYVSRLVTQFQIDQLIGIGKEISSQKHLFKTEANFFINTESFVAESKTNPDLQFHNSIILLKGARSFGFEKISKQLQQKSHDTILEINLNSLLHNLNFYRSQVGKDTKIMCMVKATGYGSGSTEIAFTLQHHHADYLAVAYADEGVELRKAGIHLPIMVMSPEESSYDDMIEYRLEPEIYSFKIAKEFLHALQHKAITESYPVHIKLDTGMHRLGFEEEHLDELCSLLKKETLFKVKSIFSHLVASDDKSFDEFTNTQISLFEKMASQIENAIGYHAIKHICNSGAITRMKQAHYNMVRLGIGMYGVGFNEIEKQNIQNISSLKTRISQLKHLQAGDTVGYNRKGIASQQTTIATIPIGYADGFSRKLGSGNYAVFINGKSCKTIGNICMDMCMVDVTFVNCQEGDEVIVFETTEQLMELSKAMETIPYEVLTGISSRVKRVYVQE